MSETLSAKPHLFEDELSEAENDERRTFSEWASSVLFKNKAQGFEIHESDELKRRVTIFLNKLNLPVKGYSLVQISGPQARFRHSTGDALIIPIQILEGNPKASGVPLYEGKRRFMKKNHEVEIEPKLRLLFILL